MSVTGATGSHEHDRERDEQPHRGHGDHHEHDHNEPDGQPSHGDEPDGHPDHHHPDHLDHGHPDHDHPDHHPGHPDHGHPDHDHPDHDHPDHDHPDHDHPDHHPGHPDHDHPDRDQPGQPDSPNHDHEHPSHEHPDHEHGRGWLGRVRHAVRPHSHEAADKIDAAMEASAEGMRALWISLAVLAVTAGLQAAVVALSGSVALLGDALHNAADALTAVPLAIAFVAGRRAPTRRYTYGYGRAEDLAGVVIVVIIAASSALTAYEAATRLAHPRMVSNLIVVAIAAVVGFTGNETVARYRIRVGRKIGSAALVADGLHARTDGFTSLAVLLGVGGAALGWRWADPVVGLLITVAILAVLRQAAREIYRRLMDAVDPALIDQAELTLRAAPGVQDVGQVRMRWIGHQLRAECEIIVDPQISAVQAHEVAVNAEHDLLHALPRLSAATVHADPGPQDGTDHHALLAPHR